MKRNSVPRMIALSIALVAVIAGCGGGGGGGGGSAGPTYSAATSSSYSPTMAKDKTTGTQNVPLHWVYTVNGGSPVSTTFSGLNVSIAVSSAEITLSPGDLKRNAVLQGPISGTFEGQAFSGNFSASIVDDLAVSSGKTTFSSESFLMNLTISAQGTSESAQANFNVRNLVPPYEWFLDRENLGDLATGSTFTNNCSGTAAGSVTIAGQTNSQTVPVSLSDTWTVQEKLASMTVQGKSYNNVVKVSRQTKVPDLSGNMTPVTMYYWVAKGVGMIKGQGIFKILDANDIVIELTDTNLVQ